MNLAVKMPFLSLDVTYKLMESNIGTETVPFVQPREINPKYFNLITFLIITRA